MQTKATADFLISQKKRPYILTRSNFPGIGKYGHHWMGDNWSTVDYMKLSVDGIYSYNLFALPFMGSDICGFNGDAAPDLCTRWHILGSLYPFARNHNQNASTSQEPYVFNQTIPGTTKKYVDVIRTALINRYSFIKYYYSSLYNIYLEGGSFFKPLFYEYPQDKKAFIDVEVNILLGDAMKLSMETTTLDFVKYPQRQYYFPKDRWCQILPALTKASTDCFDSPGDADGYLTLDSNIEAYYIHLRNGYVLPYQDAQKNMVRKTKDLEKYPTDLWILPLSDN
jgi:alpha-glucosidase (family GH31 glycosyl hydrolase)